MPAHLACNFRLILVQLCSIEPQHRVLKVTLLMRHLPLQHGVVVLYRSQLAVAFLSSSSTIPNILMPRSTGGAQQMLHMLP